MKTRPTCEVCEKYPAIFRDIGLWMCSTSCRNYELQKRLKEQVNAIMDENASNDKHTSPSEHNPEGK